MSRIGISRLWGKITVLVAVCGWGLSAQAKYDGGSGEPNNPYQISSVADWQELMATPADWASHFVLTADIDLNGVSITPIAPDTSTSYRFQGTPFTGVFDGNDYVVRNVDVNMPGSDYVGLFGYLGTGGQIRNLGVDDASILGRNCVGGVVGYNLQGAVGNCYSSGSVSGGSLVAGLVGGNGGTITNCYSTGSASGQRGVGGLAGYNGGTIRNCYSSGPVSGGKEVGGLVGDNTNGTISNCYSAGLVSGTADYVGGLVGNNVRGGKGGMHYHGKVAACFWDTQTSGCSGSAAGTGLTTPEMKTAQTFQLWGTCGSEGVWTIDEAKDYPRLWWENQPGEAIRLAKLSDLVLGTGTQSDPFLIYTPEELNMVGLFPCEWDKHFKLMTDIDLSGLDGKDGRATFNIIAPGGMSQCRDFIGTPFKGVFEGNDYVIRNADLNMPDRDDVGLLGGLGTSGQIKNLGVENMSILGRSRVGGLVAVNNGTITNCYSTGPVSGTAYYVAGLVGRNDDGSISNSYSSCSVSGGFCVGGLVGGRGNHCRDGTISNCYSTGSVSGTDYVGGLLGSYYGAVSNSYSSGSVSGTGSYVGGLVGRDYGGTMSSSFWDLNTSGWPTSSGGTPKTTAEMKTQSTFTSAGWGFIEVWDIGENQTYPFLRTYAAGDINHDGVVDFRDIAYLAESWLSGL